MSYPIKLENGFLKNHFVEFNHSSVTHHNFHSYFHLVWPNDQQNN